VPSFTSAKKKGGRGNRNIPSSWQNSHICKRFRWYVCKQWWWTLFFRNV